LGWYLITSTGRQTKQNRLKPLTISAAYQIRNDEDTSRSFARFATGKLPDFAALSQSQVSDVNHITVMNYGKITTIIIR
jgi:hypothetical protein